MLDVFFWSLDWIPWILRFPIKALCILLLVIVIIKVVQLIMSVFFAVLGWFL